MELELTRSSRSVGWGRWIKGYSWKWRGGWKMITEAECFIISQSFFRAGAFTRNVFFLWYSQTIPFELFCRVSLKWGIRPQRSSVSTSDSNYSRTEDRRRSYVECSTEEYGIQVSCSRVFLQKVKSIEKQVFLCSLWGFYEAKSYIVYIQGEAVSCLWSWHSCAIPPKTSYMHRFD